MELILSHDIPVLPHRISYTDSVMLIGSCFTEHISDRLLKYKLHILPNPHGILFNPLSVAQSLNSYLDNKQYTGDDLFYLNELWNSWDHHTRFSHISKQSALELINSSQENASVFINKAGWLIITLGSAFQYYLINGNRPVGNNHRAQAQWFEKRLLGIDEIVNALDKTLQKLFSHNRGIKVMFTISPVRHIRDGVVDNNRSKARLIEAVHALCSNFNQVYYFPAYELVIDILRDYRFYDIDFVHPNYLATQYVWEQFVATCMEPGAQKIIEQVHDIVNARAHRPRFPDTEAHKMFKADFFKRSQALKEKFPFLDLEEELRYFAEQ